MSESSFQRDDRAKICHSGVIFLPVIVYHLRIGSDNTHSLVVIQLPFPVLRLNGARSNAQSSSRFLTCIKPPFSQNETGASMAPFGSGQALFAGVFVNPSFRGSWLRASIERFPIRSRIPWRRGQANVFWTALQKAHFKPGTVSGTSKWKITDKTREA
jgi:hypothetical protein